MFFSEQFLRPFLNSTTSGITEPSGKQQYHQQHKHHIACQTRSQGPLLVVLQRKTRRETWEQGCIACMTQTRFISFISFSDRV